MTGKIAAIFDLDGTLIDSAPDLRAALNRVLAARDLPQLSGNELQSMIGDGAKALVERGFLARGRQASPEDLADFLADYEENATVETVVYPGMMAALEQLVAGGHRLGVCTNKPDAAAAIILQNLGLRKFFQVLVGGDSTPFRKPDPRHLAGAVTALGGGRAVMIGDHENDMAAARGLGLPSIFAAWGYGTAQGTHTAHLAAELPAIVASL
jgi:phosphoglycolate phosphatase